MKRNIYDKSCYQAICGEIGRLQTVFRLPVLANDTVSINFAGIFRLSQLRRWLALDCNIHLALYYVKHRWCYDGSGATATWDSFVKNSLGTERGSASTLETITAYQNGDIWCQPNGSSDNVLPAHIVKGYNKIWNRWYRIPNVSDEVADDYTPNATSNGDFKRELQYGYPVARLPSFWNTGVPTSRLTADSTITESGGAGNMTLLDIATIQAEYQDDLDREWFAHRYRDIMASKWGSNGITNEVDDDQAELLFDWSGWASGIDIHQTDSGIGNYVGKTQSIINFSMPPRYFNEHGEIWCVMVPRFPSICSDEVHYLQLNTLTADNFLCYPESVRSQPPIEILENDCFEGGSTNSYGKVPYANWYRFNNNRVHEDFKTATGFPFIRYTDLATTGDHGHEDVAYDGGIGTDVYNPSSNADAFFKEVSTLRHWNMISKAEIEVRSVLPTASESIFAGSTHIN